MIFLVLFLFPPHGNGGGAKRLSNQLHDANSQVDETEFFLLTGLLTQECSPPPGGGGD